MDITPYLLKRTKRIRKEMTVHKIEWYLVSKSVNVKYITGMSEASPFHKDLWVLIGKNEMSFYHSPLIFPPQEIHSLGQVVALGPQTPLSEHIKQKVGQSPLAVEMDDLTVSQFRALEQKINVGLIDGIQCVEKSRRQKDAYEIACLRKAGQIAIDTWEYVKNQIKPGVSEKNLQQMLITHLTREGVAKVSEEFLPIVASGKNSAIPHHHPSNKLIQPGDVVLVDFGCSVEGYWSDMTRTIKLGVQDQEFLQVETVVKTAYQNAREAIEKTRQVDKADELVFEHLQKHGHGLDMPHTTGHGIGLEIHEWPSISRHASGTLENQSVFTIEPGIYRQGKYGYRYENTLLLEDDTVSELTLSELPIHE